MNGDQYPQVALNGRVDGHRGKGQPKKRWLDMIKKEWAERGLGIIEAQRAATN